MYNLYFKNFIATAGLVIISFLLLGITFIVLGRSVIIDEKREDMSVNAQEVARTAAAFGTVDGLESWELRMVISSISQTTGTHIFLTDDVGVVLSCSDREMICPHIRQSLSPTVMAAASAGGMDVLSTLGDFYPERRYVVAVEVPHGATGETVGYVFISEETTSFHELWEAFLGVFLMTALAVLFLAVILSFIASKRQAGPINRMAQAARRFAHGDFSVRVHEENREDEIGDLSAAFNEMADALEKSEELRSAFIANVSHELKTPMTAISGFADGILDGTIPSEMQKRYLQTISSETKRLSRLVRSMLELSRLQAAPAEELRKKTFDISELIRLTLINFVDKIEQRGLDVDAQLPEERMAVRGDSDAITQVLYNLMDNAVKFAPEGSTIGLCLWKENGKAYVSVKNSGETIPPEELQLIFDRFHKTDHSRGRDKTGVGLGLYIVKTILNNHDEDITVTSRDGVTEFVFTMTLA